MPDPLYTPVISVALIVGAEFTVTNTTLDVTEGVQVPLTITS